jgi:heme o synthase
MESATNTGELAPAIPAPLAARRPFAKVLRDYLTLTKPRIIALLLVTTVATMFVADPSGPGLATVLWTMLGGYLAAGGAGAINHYLERDRDARMARTCGRPLVAGRIEPRRGLAFGIALGALAVAELTLAVNALAAALALAGLLGYVFVYTLWLKPLTPQNIVIGGASGAMPPVLGWVAVTGELSSDALLLFLIIFAWTPPHFWALALYRKREYEKAGIPMLPVTHGDRYTQLHVLLYTLILLAASMLPFATRMSGLIYLAAALALGAVFVWYAVRIYVDYSDRLAQQTFRYSIVYLSALFAALLVDHYWRMGA